VNLSLPSVRLILAIAVDHFPRGGLTVFSRIATHVDIVGFLCQRFPNIAIDDDLEAAALEAHSSTQALKHARTPKKAC
jgi:hypothetical protein